MSAFRQLKCLASQFQRLESQTQGVSRNMLALRALEENLSVSFPQVLVLQSLATDVLRNHLFCHMASFLCF